MAFSDLITKLSGVDKNPVVERALKTFVEATAAQAALYTTVVPSSPGVKGAAAVSGGATAVSILWNLVIQWAVNARSARLDSLAKAIDAAVDARLAAQAAQTQVPEHVQVPPPPTA